MRSSLVTYVVLVVLSVHASVCETCAAEPAWTSPNRYRLLLKVDPRGVKRSHSPACVDLDFQRTLAEQREPGKFDTATVKVVALDKSGKPRVFDAAGQGDERCLLPWRIAPYYGSSKVTFSFVMPDETCTQYAVYFDTAESGLGKPKRYPGLIGDGDWFREEYKSREIAASKMDDFADFDGDGDLDLFKVTVEPYIYCYENVGGNHYVDRGRMTSGGEVFVLPHDGSFRSWAVLKCDDWDGDGDQDLFVGFSVGAKGYVNEFIAFENTMRPGGPPKFEERGPLKTIGGTSLGSYWFASMTITDWDGDGKKDIVASHLSTPTNGPLKEYHRVIFHKNMSRGGNPWDFKLAEGKILRADGKEIEVHAPRVEVADIDGDGDLDLFTAEQNGNVDFFKNVGTRTAPVLATGTIIAKAGGHSGVKVADFTGDGLPDLVVGDLWGGGLDPDKPGFHARLCRSFSTHSGPKFEDADADHGAPYTKGFQTCDVGRQNVVRAVDWNNDGKTDLLAGNETGTIYFYRNLTDELFPVFAPGQVVLTKLGSAPRTNVCDWNNDGKKDLIVANMDGELKLFLNEGTDAEPRFGSGERVEANGKPIDGTHWGNVLVCDWNNDGRKDVIFGMAGESNKSEYYDWPHRDEKDPSLDKGFLFYKNVGTDAEPLLAAPKWIEAGGKFIEYIRPNVGSYFDWDGDGKKDFIACEFENIIRFYKNIGTGAPNTEPQLAEGVDIVHPRTVQLVSGAQAIDWNHDGDLDIVTGQGHGGSGLRFFERDYIEDNLKNTHPVVTMEHAERKP